MTEAVKYSNLSRPKAPGIAGFSPVQFLTLVAAVFMALILLFFVNFWAGLGWIALAFVAMTPWVIGTMVFDSNPYARVAHRVRFGRATRKGLTVLAQGPTGLVSHGSLDLPGVMADSELLEAEDTYGNPFAMIHHRSVDHYSVVIDTRPEGVVGLDQEDIDRRAAMWGTYLASLARQRDLIGVQVVVETVPDSGLRLERAAMANLDPSAPEFSQRVLRKIVETAPAGSAQITTTVTLTFDAAKHDGKGVRDVDTMADDIGTCLPEMISTLRLTGAGHSLRSRVAADIVDDTRVAFDPSVATAIEKARSEDGTGLTWSECGPVSAHSGKDYYAHDGSVSTSVMMVEPPKGVFYTLQLKELLRPSERVARKRVALLYRPMDPALSAQLADWRVTSATSNADSRRNTGPSERRKAALASAKANAKAEAEGAPFVRIGLIATATVEDIADLPTARSALMNLAGQARLKFRPCWGMHDTAFVASMPLGIVLPERSSLPGVLRETM